MRYKCCQSLLCPAFEQGGQGRGTFPNSGCPNTIKEDLLLRPLLFLSNDLNDFKDIKVIKTKILQHFY